MFFFPRPTAGITVVLWLFQLFLAHVIFRDRDYPNITVSIDNRYVIHQTQKTNQLKEIELKTAGNQVYRGIFIQVLRRYTHKYQGNTGLIVSTK